MKLDTVFFRNLSLAAFDGLNDYHAVMELQLKTLKENDRKKIEDDIKKLDLSDEELRVEWDLAMQAHTATFNMMYTNFYRYSFVILLFLALEDWLHRLCLAVQDFNGIPNPPPKSSLKESRKYLTEAEISVSNKLWEVAYDLQKVRDCIVHTSGDVTHSRDKRFLRAMAQRNKGIKISSQLDRDDEEPLYLGNDMLFIQSDYCESTIKDSKVLIEELCNKVPLEKIDFKVLFSKKAK